MLYSIENHALEGSLENASDDILLTEIAQKNERALNLIYRRHQAQLRSIILRVIRDSGHAEEVLQDVFVEVWKCAGRFSSEKGAGLGWLITLARRRAIDRVRRMASYAQAQERFQAHEAAFPEEDRENVDEDVASNDRTELLKKIMTKLPVAQREAVELAFFKGLSQREIARETNIPLGTIKTRLELGLRKIRCAVHESVGETFAAC